MDSRKIKAFWNARADKIASCSLESLSNLEPDPSMAQKKVKEEREKILPAVAIQSSDRVLDLGSGTGQWACEFAKNAKYVCAVESSPKMQALAMGNARSQGIFNIEFVECLAQEFHATVKFDLIFISGLMIYLNDCDALKLVKNCANNLTDGGRLVLRDGTGLNKRFEINDVYSKELSAQYSAIYRTADDYIEMFESNSFCLDYHQDMFSSVSELNKRKETRLRLYCFKNARGFHEAKV